MDQSQAVLALRALAHDQRLKIFRVLVRAGPSGLAAGDVAEAIGVSAAGLTFHMKELERAGLTRSWREGRFVRSSLCVDAMRALLSFLTQECCEGRPELCGSAFVTAAGVCASSKEEGR